MVKNVYKSDKYIISKKYNLNISVPYETLWYCLLPPMTPLTMLLLSGVNKTMALLIKPCPDTCTLCSNLMHRQTGKCTDMLLYILVASDTLHHSAKFQPSTSFQSKIILSHVNSSDYPLAGLKHTSKFSSTGYHKNTPYIHAYKTLLKIFNISGEIGF